MRLGWIGSVIAHAVMVVLTFVAWPRDSTELPSASAVVPVEIIDKITDVTNVSAMAPPTPEDPDSAEVTPEGAPQEITQPEPDAPEAIADPRLKQKKKDEPRRPSTDLRSLADLIDRSKKNDGAPRPSTASEEGDHPRDKIGEGTGMSATESDAIIAAIERRRQKFSDLPNYERYRVTIRVQINANGTLASNPRVMATSLPQTDPYMQVAVERSIRAILTAEPLPVAPNRTTRATFTMVFYDR